MANVVTWNPTTTGVDWPAANIEIVGVIPAFVLNTKAASGHVLNLNRVNACTGLNQIVEEIFRRYYLNSLGIAPASFVNTGLLALVTQITDWRTLIDTIRSVEGASVYSWSAAPTTASLNLAAYIEELRTALQTNKMRIKLRYADLVGAYGRDDLPWLTKTSESTFSNVPYGSIWQHGVPEEYYQTYFGINTENFITDRTVTRGRSIFLLPIPASMKAILTGCVFQIYLTKVTAATTPQYQSLGNPDPVQIYHVSGTTFPNVAQCTTYTKLLCDKTPIVLDALNSFTFSNLSYLNNDNNYIMLAHKGELLETVSDPNPAGATHFSSMAFIRETTGILADPEPNWYYELTV